MVSQRLMRRVVAGGICAGLVALVAFGAGWDAPLANGGSSITARQHGPIVIRERHEHMTSSTNWSGYVVTGAANSVTAVKGSWVVPHIQGACPATSLYSAFWVGIDGYNSSTVEQIGTDADCVNGAPVYYAWVEIYPHPSYVLHSVPINPGDTISASVIYANEVFTLVLTNHTTGQSFHTSTRVQNAQRSSAEWIAEAPASARGIILPLADFGQGFFGRDYTGVALSSAAIIGGTFGPIGSFKDNVQQISMVSGKGVTEAVPSSLSANGSSFTVQWENSGQ